MSKTPIEPADIREGDLIREEYEAPRLTDEGVEQCAIEYRAGHDHHTLARRRASAHYLLDRPKPTSTTVPTGALDELRAALDAWELGADAPIAGPVAAFLSAVSEANA